MYIWECGHLIVFYFNWMTCKTHTVIVWPANQSIYYNLRVPLTTAMEGEGMEYDSLSPLLYLVTKQQITYATVCIVIVHLGLIKALCI